MLRVLRRVASTSSRVVRSSSSRISVGMRTFSSIPEEELKGDELHVRWKAAISERDDELANEEDISEEDLELDDVSSIEMSKRLLELGRVPYRHVDSMPEWLLEKQQEICAHRTSAQIRRCLKSWMIKYDQELMMKYRQRRIGWSDVAHHEAQFSEAGEDSGAKKRIIYGPEETTAYSHYHMPSRYIISRRIFSELKTVMKDFQPKRILDFGCGPATAAAAAHSVWPEAGAIEHYHGIDISQAMIDAGKIMTRDIIPNATFWNRNADILQRAINKGERYDLIVASYTLTELPTDAARKAATQMLFELLDVNGVLLLLEAGSPFGSHTVRTARQYLIDMHKTVDKYGKFESPNYHALNQDPTEVWGDEDSELGGNEQKLKKKKNTSNNVMILPPPSPKLKYTDLLAKVVAPCTHDRPCPIQSGGWCSFAQKVYSGVIRKDAEEKFSYVVMQKLTKSSVGASSKQAKDSAVDKDLIVQTDRRWVAPDRRPFDALTQVQTTEDIRVASPLQLIRSMMTPSVTADKIRTFAEEMDWETYDPLLRREDHVRLLRSPLKSKSHLTMDLCLPTGRLDRFVHARATVAEVPRFYNAIRKASWGGLIPSYMLATLSNKQTPTSATETKYKHVVGNKGKANSNSNTNTNINNIPSAAPSTGKKSDKKQKVVEDDEFDVELQKAFDQLMAESNTFPAAASEEAAPSEEAVSSGGRRRRANVRRSTVRRRTSSDDE